jgi:fluoride exporter
MDCVSHHCLGRRMLFLDAAPIDIGYVRMLQTLLNSAWMPWLSVMTGAAIGAALRYGIVTHVVSGWQGILVVNLLGCLLFGIVLGLLKHPALSTSIASSMQLFLLTGMMGALTTFSSYIYDAYRFIMEAPAASIPIAPLITNIMVQNVGGLLLFISGLWVAGRLIK